MMSMSDSGVSGAGFFFSGRKNRKASHRRRVMTTVKLMNTPYVMKGRKT
jgi:hypothetical protein